MYILKCLNLTFVTLKVDFLTKVASKHEKNLDFFVVVVPKMCRTNLWVARIFSSILI